MTMSPTQPPAPNPAAFAPGQPPTPGPNQAPEIPQLPVGQRYKVLNMTATEIQRHQRAVQTNMSTRSRATHPFKQINLPPRGMDIWAVPGVNETLYYREIEGIILHIAPPRAYFPKLYDPSGPKEPPACSSIDGITGYGNNGYSMGQHDCFTCPQNVYGTGQGGRSRACREHRTVHIFTPDQAWPVVIQVPVTSFRFLDDYMARLTQNGLPCDTVVTRFSLRKLDEENTVIAFAIGEVLSPEEEDKVQALAQPIIDSIKADSLRRTQQALTSNAMDMEGIIVEATTTDPAALPAPERSPQASGGGVPPGEYDGFADPRDYPGPAAGFAPEPGAGFYPEPNAGFPPEDPRFAPQGAGFPPAGPEGYGFGAAPGTPPAPGQTLGLDPSFDV